MSPETSKEASVAEAEQVGRKGIREAGKKGLAGHTKELIFLF